MTIEDILKELESAKQDASRRWQEHQEKDLWPEDDDGSGERALGESDAYNHAISLIKKLEVSINSGKPRIASSATMSAARPRSNWKSLCWEINHE